MRRISVHPLPLCDSLPFQMGIRQGESFPCPSHQPSVSPPHHRVSLEAQSPLKSALLQVEGEHRTEMLLFKEVLTGGVGPRCPCSEYPYSWQGSQTLGS